MTQGLVSYPGVTTPKGATYTQNRGITPDIVLLKMVPQVTAVAAIGDVTFSYGASVLVLPDCLADRSNVWWSGQGFVGSITLQDRRWRWSRYPAVSYHWNERDADGVLVTTTQLSLRGMVTQVLSDIGESAVNVSAVADDFYPEVDVYCMRPDLLLDQITSQFGYGICLGFSTEDVYVVRLGIGSALPTANLMTATQGLDPPTPPQYVRVCYAPSVAQARFKLIAVGLDVDGIVKPIDDLTYKPSHGWGNEHPSMPTVRATFGEHSDEYFAAIQTVYRWYMIDKFADDTLTLPDDSGTLSDIKQCLPLLQRLVETEVHIGRPQHPRPRVYGIYLKSTSPTVTTAQVGDQVEEPFTIDEYRGIVMFQDPMIQLNYEYNPIGPAELYLEAAFRIRNATTHQLNSYMKDTQVNASGYGYFSINEETQFARTVVTYDSSHGVTGTITNQADLDTLAAELAANVIGAYTYAARSEGWYNRPVFTIRLDGLISQVTHVITDGDDDEPGNTTRAAHNMHIDMFTRTEQQKRQDLYVANVHRQTIRNLIVEQQPRKGTDLE